MVTPGFLRKYKELVESPLFSAATDRPRSIEEIAPRIVEGLRDIAIKALQEMIPELTKEKVKITDYTPFEAAIASKVVGTVDVNLGHLVIKVGDASLERQVDYMKGFRGTPFEIYFPKVYEIDRITGAEFACFMEHLQGFSSLHDLIFLKGVNGSVEATNKVFDVLQGIYESFRQPGIANLRECYIQRIIQRVQDAKAKFGDLAITTDYRFADLLDTTIQLGDLTLLSYNRAISLLADLDLDSSAPSFTTFIHGDAHPANIMFNNDHFENLKFIDLNGDLRRSDYMYDIGKFFHWVDNYGLIALERALKKEFVRINIDKAGDYAKVSVDNSAFFSGFTKAQRIFELRDEILARLNQRWKKFSRDVGDTQGPIRFHLSVASAYLGGLPHQSEKTHLALVFVKGLEYLNRFLLDSGKIQ